MKLQPTLRGYRLHDYGFFYNLKLRLSHIPYHIISSVFGRDER